MKMTPPLGNKGNRSRLPSLSTSFVHIWTDPSDLSRHADDFLLTIHNYNRHVYRGKKQLWVRIVSETSIHYNKGGPKGWFQGTAKTANKYSWWCSGPRTRTPGGNILSFLNLLTFQVNFRNFYAAHLCVFSTFKSCCLYNTWHLQSWSKFRFTS